MMDKTGQQPPVENLLHILGPRGRYQMSMLFVSVLIAIPDCYQLLDNVFILKKTPHHCAKLTNDSEIWIKYKDANITYDECEIVMRSHGDVVHKGGCVSGVEYEEPIKYSAESEFNLVCDDATLAKLSQTLLIGGQGVGAVLITIFSDRFGRKLGLVTSNLGLLVCGIVIAFAPNFIVFVIFKFIIGGYQQGVLTSMNTYALELLVLKDRRLVPLCRGLVWAGAAVSMPLIAYFLRYESWRYLQLTLTLTALPVFFQMWFLDESIRWLIVNGKIKKAQTCIRRAARYNDKDYDLVMKEFSARDVNTEACEEVKEEVKPETSETESVKDVQEVQDTNSASSVDNSFHVSATKKLTILDLLRVRRLLINALACWYSWFIVALGYFNLYLTATSLRGDPYLNFALVASMQFPAVLTIFLGVNRFGRKRTIVFLFSLQAGGLLVMGISKYLECNETFPVLTWNYLHYMNVAMETAYNSDVFGKLTLAASMIGMVGSSGAFDAVYFYTPEFFPTNLRNQALGVSSFMSRFGGMLAPFTSVFADQVVWGPDVVIGACSLIACLLIGLVLPETSGRELPQTLEDLEAWYKKSEENSEDSESNRTGQQE